MKNPRILFGLPLVLLLLSLGCGGGGGGGGGGTTPVTDSPLLASVGLLDFGEVPIGTEKLLSFEISNPEAEAIEVTAAEVPSGGFSLAGASLPITIPAGGSVDLTLRYVAGQIGLIDGAVRFDHAVPDGRLVLPVRATTGGQVVRDYGEVFLDPEGRTTFLTVAVPADAVSLTLEGYTEGSESTEIGLEDLFVSGQRVWTEHGDGGDYTWRKGTEIFSTTVPNTDRAELDLLPGGGTYVFRLVRLTGNTNRMQVRAIVERRPGGDGDVATLDLNVWLGSGVAPYAANAATHPRLQAILSTMDTVLSQQGIRLGDIDYYDVQDPRYDVLEREDMPELLRLTSRAAETRLNLFFVNQVYNTAVVGASPTISGPARNATGESGLAVVFDGGLTFGTIGAVAAHEAGHYFGLYHTVESSGLHDIIDDTVECPAVGTSPVCPRDGGGLLMHWEYLGGTLLTAGQGKVLRAHPLMEPRRAAGAAPATLLYFPEVDTLPDGWCAECR